MALDRVLISNGNPMERLLGSAAQFASDLISRLAVPPRWTRKETLWALAMSLRKRGNV